MKQISAETQRVELLNYMEEQLDESVRKFEFGELVKAKKIGAGGFGEVWKGYLTSSSEKSTVAIKSIFHLDKQHVDVFLREINIHSKLQHENICKLVGVVLDTRGAYLLTEFISRGSMFEIIHNKNLEITLEKVLSFLFQTAKGMSYLHNIKPIPILQFAIFFLVSFSLKNVSVFSLVSRDLKSQNLLIDEEWTVKICDFGMSRTMSSTSTMTKLGTLQWVAPEVLRNEKYSEKADVYSFAILVWELLERKIPYSGRNSIEVAKKVAYSSLRPNVPAKCDPLLEKIMTTCWQEQSSMRPTFDELQDSLHSRIVQEKNKN